MTKRSKKLPRSGREVNPIADVPVHPQRGHDARLKSMTAVTKFDSDRSGRAAAWASTPARPTSWSAAPLNLPARHRQDRPGPRLRPLARSAHRSARRRRRRASAATTSSQKVADGYTRLRCPPSPPPTSWARSAASDRVLGPRGLMPNPKTGTVTMDVAKAVKDIKGGQGIDFRVDKHANLALPRRQGLLHR